jgi:hypothetical protein
MAAPEYRFLTRWSVLGTVSEVADVLGDAKELSRWWPAVYLSVQELEAGDERGVGHRVRLRTKGVLPYTLDWELRVSESRYPHGFTVEAEGDLAGRGVWTFDEAGARTLATYEWHVRAEKPLLKLLSPLLRPLFSANHRWAMRRGEESLELELARRRAATPAERSRIPAPPAPAEVSPTLVLGVGAAAGLAAYGLVRLLSGPRRRRRRWR